MPEMPAHIGNAALWEQPKTGFLCSRKCPAAALLKIYDWAQQARTAGVCVMSGFHTAIESDVWEILIKGEQPVILVLPRALPKRKRKLSAEKECALEVGRLLIVSSAENLPRATPKSAHQRNIFILENADKMIIGYATPNGRLSPAIEKSAAPTTFLYE